LVTYTDFFGDLPPPLPDIPTVAIQSTVFFSMLTLVPHLLQGALNVFVPV
jgi:hypothetical protein